MAKSTTKQPKTSSTKTAAAKKTPRSQTTATKKASSKITITAGAKPIVTRETKPVVTDPALKKKELIDIVVERSGVKKKDAKPVIEAMLAVLGQTLSEGREMNLQPFGKVKINRSKDVQGGKVLVAKIRQSNRVPKEPVDPVAKAAE